MPLNRALVGREYGPSEVYEVGREHVRQFALAVGEHSAVHTDAEAARAAGYDDVVAPPTFLTTLTFRFAADSPTVDPELGLDYSRVVHGTQEFRFSRPVVAGDRLRMTTRVSDVRAAGGHEFLVTESDVVDADGAHVATLVATIVSRGTAVKEDR